jgi:SAM-dependent methyltransferase
MCQVGFRPGDHVMIDPIVVCPVCRGALSRRDAKTTDCNSCEAAYEHEGDYPVLLVPGDKRFDDESDCCRFDSEDVTNTYTTKNYHLPLLRRLIGRDLSGVRVLSAGCGVGADVDVLRDAGVSGYGVDCGSRISAWPNRRHPHAFQIGSVANLPYPDDTFDAVFTGCLLPHIGVMGDTTTLAPNADDQRARAAADLLRVVRPGGYIVMGSPNRLCPVDLFHKGQMASANSLVRWHWPSERFLLSFGDEVELFGTGAKLETLPVSGYWGFHTKESRAATRWMARAMKLYFALLSLPPLGALRRSPLNPWLMVLVTKAA